MPRSRYGPTCEHDRDRFVVLRDGGSTVGLTVKDAQCPECQCVVAFVDRHLEGQTIRTEARLSKVYLKREYGIPCGCARPCRSYWCRVAAA